MEKMKEKYMVIPIVILAVLISVSSAPAMQTTFMSEYQPICPEESYNKITELHEEGWSEEEIAETLELPIDVVSGFLSDNYTIISSCPEPYQKSEKKVTPEKSMEQWRKEHTVKVKAIRTLKYEQGYLISKEIYTGEEFKKRFGRDNFTKELRIPVDAETAKAIGIREGEERTSVTEEERVFAT